MRFRHVLALICLGFAFGLACGGGGGASTPASGKTAPAMGGGTPSGSSGGGSLIIGKGTAIAEYDIKAGTEKPLVAAPNDNTFLLDPALSPDGKRLAYVAQPPAKVANGKYDAGSDLWISNRDGSGQVAIFEHAQPNQLVRFPQWEDADHVLAVVQEISAVAGITRVVYTLERIGVNGGEREKVLENVLSFGLSPDGKRLVYAKLAPSTGETLNAADITGANDATLVGIDQNLSPFNVPRYSPNGAKIAFASADQTGARANQEYVSAAPFGRDAAAATDGLPEDIWTIDAAGGAPVRVADLKEDLPALTWSGDGKHLYVVASGGLYDVNLANGASNRIGEGVFHGQLVWAP